MTGPSHGRSLGPFLATMMLVAYLPAAGGTSIYMLLGSLSQQFDNPLRVGWTVSAYFLVGAAGAAICGRLGDLFGRRLVVMISIFIGCVGALLAAMTTDLNVIIASCALLGMTFVMTPLTIGIVRDVLPPNRIAFVIGIIATVGQVGSSVTFLIAGAVLDHYSTRGVFVMMLLLGLASLALLLTVVPRDPPHQNSLKDIRMISGVMFVPAIVGTFITLELGRRIGWTDVRTLGLLFVSLAVLGAWAIVQWRQDNPLINVRSLLSRQVGLANLITVLISMGGLNYGLIAPLILRQPAWTGAGLGLSPTTAGSLLMVSGLIGLVGGPLSGHLIALRGGRIIAIAGCATIMAGWVATLLEHHNLWFLVGCMTIINLGISIVLPAVYTLIVEATPADRTSEASGLNLVFLSTFISVGSQLVLLIMSGSTLPASDGSSGVYYSDHAFQMSFIYVIALSILSMIAGWALPRRKPA